jgi:hypothetical protein
MGQFEKVFDDVFEPVSIYFFAAGARVPSGASLFLGIFPHVRRQH